MNTLQSRFNIRSIRRTNDQDLKFTYDLLKKRFSANRRINILDHPLPSYDQHVGYIQSDRYEYYYIVSFNNIEFMVVYTIRDSKEAGYFIDPIIFAKILSLYNNQIYNNSDKIDSRMTRTKKAAAYATTQGFHLLLEKHSELKTNIHARVAAENTFGQETAILCGLKPQAIKYKLFYNNKSHVPEESKQFYNIRKINKDSEKDISFTYDILKLRFDKDYINIHNDKLPTRNEHIKNLRSDKYSHYYICSYGSIDLIAFYVACYRLDFGAFIHTDAFIKAISCYNNIRKDVACFSHNQPKSVQIAAYHGKIFFDMMLDENKELINTLESTVNIKNEWSKMVTETLGFKPIYISYGYTV